MVSGSLTETVPQLDKHKVTITNNKELVLLTIILFSIYVSIRYTCEYISNRYNDQEGETNLNHDYSLSTRWVH